jgi:hypothetical protein
MSANLRGLFLLAAGTLTGSFSFGQSIAVGAIGGTRITDDLAGEAATSVSGRYVVGPELDIGLPFGLGIEVDALYRRLGYRLAGFFGNTPPEHANSWEFPMLIKCRLPFHAIKPFVETGYAPRVIYAPANYSSNAIIPASHGFVIGGGVQFGIGRLTLVPAVRYTVWSNAPVVVYFGNGPESQSSQNQVDILLGISWKLH